MKRKTLTIFGIVSTIAIATYFIIKSFSDLGDIFEIEMED